MNLNFPILIKFLTLSSCALDPIKNSKIYRMPAMAYPEGRESDFIELENDIENLIQLNEEAFTLRAQAIPFDKKILKKEN